VAGRRTILQRIYLGVVVGGQILIAPIIAFSITYLVDIDTEAYAISLRMELLPWIVSAAAAYGVISLLLALLVGGWIPRRVADVGGWSASFGFSNRIRDPEMVDRARMRLRRGPFGKMGRIVHREVHEKGGGLLEIHGGLQILAAPLQIALVLIPVAMIQVTPSNMIVEGRMLEFGLFGYILALTIGLRIFPVYAGRLVGVASVVRRAIGRITRFSWMAPVLLLWLFVRIGIAIAFDQLGIDIENWQRFAVEKRFLEALLPVTIEVPESSFIDLLVALSVLPVATFTTLVTVIGGGAVVPRWMMTGEDRLEKIDEQGDEAIQDGPSRLSDLEHRGGSGWEAMPLPIDISSDETVDGTEDTGEPRFKTEAPDATGGVDVHISTSESGGEDGVSWPGEANDGFVFPQGSFGDGDQIRMPGVSGWVAGKLTDRIEPRLRRTRE